MPAPTKLDLTTTTMRQRAVLPRPLSLLFLAWALLQMMACAAVRAQELPVQTVVDKMAAVAVFRLAPEQVGAYFEAVSPLISNAPGKYLWVHDNNAPGKGLAWVRVEYQPGSNAKWVFLQSSVAWPLGSPEQGELYEALKVELRKKLGKPEFSNEQAADKTVVWSMGGARKLILRRGPIHNPYLKKTQELVMLEASNAQGEEDRPKR